MQDQSRRLSQPLTWGRRERIAMGTFLAILALSLAGLLAYALTSGSPARADCISVTFPSTLGGAQISGCGDHARKICATPQILGGQAQALEDACRKAGFPVGTG